MVRTQQLQRKKLPPDQIPPHGVGQIHPLELIAADPFDHFLTVSCRIVYDLKRDVQAMEDRIPIIIHQQPPAPDGYWVSTARVKDLRLQLFYGLRPIWQYQLTIFLTNL